LRINSRNGDSAAATARLPLRFLRQRPSCRRLARRGRGRGLVPRLTQPRRAQMMQLAEPARGMGLSSHQPYRCHADFYCRTLPTWQSPSASTSSPARHALGRRPQVSRTFSRSSASRPEFSVSPACFPDPLTFPRERAAALLAPSSPRRARRAHFSTRPTPRAWRPLDAPPGGPSSRTVQGLVRRTTKFGDHEPARFFSRRSSPRAARPVRPTAVTFGLSSKGPTYPRRHHGRSPLLRGRGRCRWRMDEQRALQFRRAIRKPVLAGGLCRRKLLYTNPPPSNPAGVTSLASGARLQV